LDVFPAEYVMARFASILVILNLDISGSRQTSGQFEFETEGLLVLWLIFFSIAFSFPDLPGYLSARANLFGLRADDGKF
jgi:hypothetical protein